MVKNTQKPKTATIPSWTGRLRATAARINGQQAKATASSTKINPSSSHRVGTKGGMSRQARASPTGHPLNQAKRSQHDRMAAKKAAEASNKSLHRQRESDEQKAKRRSANAAQTSRARSEETEAATAARRSLDAAQKAKARSEETEADTALRRSLNAAQTSRARSQETADARLERQMSNATHMALARDQETVEVADTRKRADRERHAAPVSYTHELGVARRDTPVQQHYLGPMSLQCASCHALHFKGELPQNN